jgi:WD40 repeat protein
MIAGPFEGHADGVTSVAYSPDGKQIVSGSRDRTVRVWDTETGEVVAGPFEGHTKAVISVAYSPDGKQIVSCSEDQMVRVWDAKTGEVVAGPFEGHTNAVMSVAYSPDGKQIASASWDQTVRVWDSETGDVAAGPFEGHTNAIWSVAYSPDGKRIASGSRDRTVRVWDAETHELLPQLNPAAGHLTTNSSPLNQKFIFSPTHIDTGKLHNGWVLGSQSELLLWVPPLHRIGLWAPRNEAVIGRRVTRLNFSRFVHGKNWEQCKA